MVRFAAIGVVCTAAYVGLFAALRNVAPAVAANAVALVITAVANTAANRRLTFEVRGRDGLARDHAAGLLALVVALAMTSGSLGILDVVAPHRGRLTEIAVLVAANGAATLVRFVLLRMAIDRAGRECMSAAPALAILSAPGRTRG
ncbi:MAG: GtrA family protein [Candidatus Limnocylindrales bacterium]|jgi:putative flippase GtrA